MTFDVIRSYNYLFHDLADSRVQDWLLLSTPWIPIGTIILYLFVIYSWLPKYMENRTPFVLKSTLKLYNIAQIICCTFIMRMVFATDETNYSLGCYPIDYSLNPVALRSLEVGWWMYILKCVDLSETVFFVMRKKNNQVTVLHVYHHVVTLLIAWFSAKYISGGMTHFVTVINCGVHVVMYTYYFLSSLGIEMQAKLAKVKPLVTILQMVQLCLILTQLWIAAKPDCNTPTLLVWMYIPNIAVFLMLFGNFYIKNYTRKTKMKL